MRNRNNAQQMRYRRISLLLLFQLFSIILLAQVRISGKVTADNKGLPDISVVVHNTNVGSSTDAEGNYSFQANLKPGTYQLDFSGVGYKAHSQSIQVGSSGTVTADAQLVQDALKMDEVVVTGVTAGTTRKQLGSYISTVKADELNKGATGNVLAALQGKTAGAQIIQNNGDPAGGMSVRLRGVSSILSSSEPLYIVDGVIVNNATNRVT
ncbi:MAG: carboxypeptidase-like regulatory domain-containing protein, partial [Flavisolibacter sp.]